MNKTLVWIITGQTLIGQTKIRDPCIKFCTFLKSLSRGHVHL